jgi:hypothetical protein
VYTGAGGAGVTTGAGVACTGAAAVATGAGVVSTCAVDVVVPGFVFAFAFAVVVAW